MEEMDEYTNSLSNSSCPTESTYQPLEYLASIREVLKLPPSISQVSVYYSVRARLHYTEAVLR